jgi:hypothetical protein
MESWLDSFSRLYSKALKLVSNFGLSQVKGGWWQASFEPTPKHEKITR